MFSLNLLNDLCFNKLLMMEPKDRRVLSIEYTQLGLEEMYKEQINKINVRGGQDSYSDSGFDLYCPMDVHCPPGKMTKIYLGVKCALQDGISRPLPFYLYARSSISKTPLRLANNVGIIDSGYRGQLIAAVDNIGDTDYVIKAGQRLFQICTGDLRPFNMVYSVNELNQTARGEGGFGSTGE